MSKRPPLTPDSIREAVTALDTLSADLTPEGRDLYLLLRRAALYAALSLADIGAAALMGDKAGVR